MSTLINPYILGSSAAVSNRAASVSAFPASNSGIGNAAFADVTNGSGGAPVELSFTKSAGTDLIILASAGLSSASSHLLVLGARINGTDYNLGRISIQISSANGARDAIGRRMISGLPAGTYTITLRAYANGSGAFFGSYQSAHLTVFEVGGSGTPNVQVASIALGGFTTSSTSYVDLLTAAAGSAIEVTITKGDDSDILILGGATCNQQTATDTITLGIYDGSATTDLARERSYQTSHTMLHGALMISGLPAGTYTYRLRAKTASGNQVNFSGSHSAHLTAMEVNT